MKIVFASTPDQEEKIKELVGIFYRDIFPLYFSDKEIKEFENLKVLHASKRIFEDFGTLKEAYQVITSMQTLISILESSNPLPKFEVLFYNNVRKLNEFGLFFPFEYEQFLKAKSMKTDLFSIYTKAANQLLV